MSENLNKLFSPVHVVETLTADKTVDVFDTGKVFMLSKADGLTVTLPAVTAENMNGFRCTFIVKTALTSNTYTIVSGTDDKLLGLSVASSGATASAMSELIGRDNIKLTPGAGNVVKAGDKIEVICNGSHFYVYAYVDSEASVSFNT